MPFVSPKSKKTLDLAQLQEYAVKLLSGRAMSAGGLKQKLLLKASDPDDIPKVIDTLKEYGYLNDQAFAESYAAARRDNQSFGSARVLRDLQNRRVAAPLAQKAVQQAFAGKDECELIEQFLERKFRGKNLGELLQDEKKLAGVYRRLRTAGYSTGNSVKVLKRYASRAEELESLEDES
ncbi:MAG: regulatory protein RecX [Acidobacteria bacterium]|nr:regulatory protein RecX [Acidobacteriota bacterium]